VTETPERGRLARTAWMAVGFTSVGIGSVGVIVPGLPTTVFFVVAAWCFGRSSPRFEQWVLDLPRIGPMVRDHRAGLGIPAATKRLAIASMWLAIAVSCVVLRERIWIAAAIVVTGLVGTWYLRVRVPTRK
jgi:uncharacterized membrane protein YbaN (DUF454 family)